MILMRYSTAKGWRRYWPWKKWPPKDFAEMDVCGTEAYWLHIPRDQWWYWYLPDWLHRQLFRSKEVA